MTVGDGSFPQTFTDFGASAPDVLSSINIRVMPIQNSLTPHHSGLWLYTSGKLPLGENSLRLYYPMSRMTSLPFRVYEFPFQDGSWPIYARNADDSHPPTSLAFEAIRPVSRFGASFLMWKHEDPPEIARLSMSSLSAAGWSVSVLYRSGDFTVHSAGGTIIVSLTKFNRSLSDLLIAV